jgi:hypothetical protein
MPGGEELPEYASPAPEQMQFWVFACLCVLTIFLGDLCGKDFDFFGAKSTTLNRKVRQENPLRAQRIQIRTLPNPHLTTRALNYSP